MSKAYPRPRCILAPIVIVLLAGCSGALNLPASHRPKSYGVHRGDTLYSIAWHYGLDYHKVARWNGIHYPYTIHPGERIYLYPRHRPSAKPKHVARPPKHHKRVVAKTYPAKIKHRSTASDKPAPRATSIRWQWPANGTVHATFGQNDIAGKGVVIQGKLGEPVRAASDGTVVYAGGALVGYGRLVIVKHNNEWLSAYGHNQRLLVHEGDAVHAGEQIATMGVAPDGKSELYFEIRRDGKPVNPLQFLSARR